ncbi:uncharacterized protein F5891DRAFT_1186164 [Suillus fuscotomentosus]|uniref:Pre-mRNA-splicing factor 38B n=1 Tax=Suillus fuscotomentosus TaxID=1912939 RepID=A0AAD4EAC9_9AGAM|nr:uncharacterized protein F5891DRAFT_1198518 [Suillus fuscotomentosus]XP_041228101.1 uncharacterized protein F5891DRAFT_1186164 [Suillus fuscotomentosus]KAG1889680.1 hypothetical protein F5891DRAFT_1198518 [Suillus fuscotomentosus]KAG1902526.1 hypothetical protein F5891DRAFT_1186164 [Suillus fuscotomentosus]
MSKSSLSSVVSNLVRASMGTAVSPSITDDDLDRHVAELILREAKQKAESYGTVGIRAYLPPAPDPNAPRPNKRFLSSIIKSTDDHNKTILRAQALAAQEIKREKDEQERRDRKARAEEAVAAERMRRRRPDHDEHGWGIRRERDRRRDKDRNKGKEKSPGRHYKDDKDDDSHYRNRPSKRRHQSRSPSKERNSDTKHRTSSRRSPSSERASSFDHRQHIRRRRHDDDNPRRKRRHTSRSTSPRRTDSLAQPVPGIPVSKKRTRSVSLSDDDHRKTTKQTRHLSRRTTRSPSRSSQTSPDDEAVESTGEILPSFKGQAGAPNEFPKPPPRTFSPSPPPRRPQHAVTSSGSYHSVRSPSSSPPPLPPARLPSKMDKYFQESYDPRLDVTTLPVPTVPATGLVSDAEFEGWDAMLELIRQRREDKAEKKRLERLGISKDKANKKGADSEVADRWASGGDNIMDIEYKKRGTVREWDLGKEGF